MPATVPPAGPEMDDSESEQSDGRESNGRGLIWTGGAIVVAFVGGLLVWLSDGSDTALQKKNDVPLVKAAELPVKVRPEDPGGMNVAHRDKLIYQRFEGDEATPVVERLLSAPEEPLPPPRSEPETSLSGGLAITDEAPPAEFMAAPPEDAVLAQPTEEFLPEFLAKGYLAEEFLVPPPGEKALSVGPKPPPPEAPA